MLAAARAELARLPALLDVLVGGLDADAWRTRPAPEEWSPLEIVCHLRDEEVDDFGARVRVIVERGTVLAPIDPAAWVETRRYREADPGRALAELRERRAASLAFLAEIAAAPDRLRAGVEHPRAGRLTGLDLVAAWVAHDRLHVAQLAATLARLWADRWSPLRTEYAGPIPYPHAHRREIV